MPRGRFQEQTMLPWCSLWIAGSAKKKKLGHYSLRERGGGWQRGQDKQKFSIKLNHKENI
jgi:hypothetical protein